MESIAITTSSSPGKYIASHCRRPRIPIYDPTRPRSDGSSSYSWRLIYVKTTRENPRGRRRQCSASPNSQRCLILSSSSSNLKMREYRLGDVGSQVYQLPHATDDFRYEDDGSMSRDKREVSLEQIKNNKRIRVVLIS